MYFYTHPTTANLCPLTTNSGDGFCSFGTVGPEQDRAPVYWCIIITANIFPLAPLL